MALTESETEWLTVLLENLESVRKDLYPKAQQFVDDQIKRHEDYGTRMLLSPKQSQWLEDLHREFCPGVELPDRYGRNGDDDNVKEPDHGPRDDDEVPF